MNSNDLIEAIGKEKDPRIKADIVTEYVIDAAKQLIVNAYKKCKSDFRLDDAALLLGIINKEYGGLPPIKKYGSKTIVKEVKYPQYITVTLAGSVSVELGAMLHNFLRRNGKLIYGDPKSNGVTVYGCSQDQAKAVFVRKINFDGITLVSGTTNPVPTLVRK